MRFCILTILFLTTSFSASARPIQLLILGDSLSFMPTPAAPELPALLQGLLKEQGVDIQIDTILKAGHTLELDVQEGDFAKQIKQKIYDFVIIQPYSIEALHLPACFANPKNVSDAPKGFDSYMENGKKLIAMVKAQSPRTITLLFEPWTYDNGHAWLQPDFVCRYFPGTQKTWYGGSLPAYKELLAKGYRDLSMATGTEVMPIGDLWWDVRGDNSQTVPITALYQDDHIHPTYLGSYLSALYVASRISGLSPATFSFRAPEISEAQAQYLREVAQRHRPMVSASAQ